MSDQEARGLAVRNDERSLRNEERIAILETEMRLIKEVTQRTEAKVDQLVMAFNMGRGGAVAAAKIGGILVMILAGIVWFVEHVVNWLRP